MLLTWVQCIIQHKHSIVCAQGVPLLSGCKAVFECSPFGSPSAPASRVVGSHTLWLASVERTHYNFERVPSAVNAKASSEAIVQPPLIYYMKYKSCCLIEYQIIVHRFKFNCTCVAERIIQWATRCSWTLSKPAHFHLSSGRIAPTSAWHIITFFATGATALFHLYGLSCVIWVILNLSLLAEVALLISNHLYAETEFKSSTRRI